MNADQERWAEALLLERNHDDAPRFIAEQIGRLARAGDVEGISRLKEIAARLDALQLSAHATN